MAVRCHHRLKTFHDGWNDVQTARRSMRQQLLEATLQQTAEVELPAVSTLEHVERE